ncbi:aminotransferase class I/II-fold pyridoxal phosphate-dependent enzyme, partial [Acinetobacter baumannii]
MSSAVTRRLARRIHPEAVSIRSRLLAIAGGLPDVIALGRGDPDFDPAPPIVEAARRAIDGSAAHHYTAPAGMPALREAIAAALKADFG